MVEETIYYSVLFIGLTEQEKSDIANVSEPLHFAPGDCIVRQNEPGDSLYLLAKGKVEVVVNAGEDNERVVAVLEGSDSLEAGYAGGFFGEMSLIDIEPRSATVRARTDVSLVRISARRLHDYFETHRDAHLAMITNIARILSRRLRLASGAHC